MIYDYMCMCIYIYICIYIYMYTYIMLYMRRVRGFRSRKTCHARGGARRQE